MENMTYSGRVTRAVTNAIEASGMTRHAIADRSGLAYNTLSRRINSRGDSPFNVRELDAIGRALGIPPSRFMADAHATDA